MKGVHQIAISSDCLCQMTHDGGEGNGVEEVKFAGRAHMHLQDMCVMLYEERSRVTRIIWKTGKH